jgi:hypothetical protein
VTRLDWKHLYLLVSFSIGFLAGFQAIHDRFKRDSWSASKTLPGVSYLLSRGALPAVIFFSFYASGLIQTHPLLWSLGLGVSAETILRAKFYIKEEQKEGGSIDLLKGPFDLLHWYQNFILEEAATRIAGARKQFVKSNLPREMLFLILCDRVMANLHAFSKDQESVTRSVEREVRKLKEKFAEATVGQHDADRVNKQYCELLGYAVLNNAGKKGFITLLSE